MKICVCFEGRVRPDSTGFYFLKAFKDLGHEVTHVYPDQINTVKPVDFDLFFRCDDGLSDAGWNPELHPSIYYVIDTHLETDWRLALAKNGKFDHIFTAQKAGVSLPWHTPAHWIPLGCDPDLHNVGPREKKYDVAFIGNFHSRYAGRRMEYLDKLFRALPNFFFGSRMFKEMAEKYAEAKIVFNCSLNQDINMRVFEGMASGSVLLTDRIPEMAEIGLVDGIHYVGYSNIEEMLALAKVIANGSFKDVPTQGQKLALGAHTYKHRCEAMLKKITEEACLQR